MISLARATAALDFPALKTCLSYGGLANTMMFGCTSRRVPGMITNAYDIRFVISTVVQSCRTAIAGPTSIRKYNTNKPGLASFYKVLCTMECVMLMFIYVQCIEHLEHFQIG